MAELPPYYSQETDETCSLAVLRMALGHYGTAASEQELVARITPDYGDQFHIIWKPTIARLACEYGLSTTFCAEWPLLRPDLMAQALTEFASDPTSMNLTKYENMQTADEMPKKEPLPLAYKDMFRAVALGCKYRYDRLTADNLPAALANNGLVQTLINLRSMYPHQTTEGLHEVLVFDAAEDAIHYHDPAREANMQCPSDQFFGALNSLGAFLAYSQPQ